MPEFYLCNSGRGLTCSHKVNTPAGLGCGLGTNAYDTHGNLCPYLVLKEVNEKPLNLPTKKGEK